MKPTFCLMIVLVVVPTGGEAQEPWRSAENVASIPQAELDSISNRGRILARYRYAVSHADRAVEALQPSADLVNSRFARKLSDGKWEVVFGRLNASRSAYRIAFRAVQEQPDSAAVITYEMRPPSTDTGFYLRAARAADASRRDFFRTPARSYDTLVVAADDGDEFFVYFTIRAMGGVWPHGADVRYRVSANGRTIRERRQLHGTVLEYPIPGTADSGIMAATVYVADQRDRPEDTDVYHVIVRSPRAPGIIVSKSYYFAIDLSGRIYAFNRGLRSAGGGAVRGSGGALKWLCTVNMGNTLSRGECARSFIDSSEEHMAEVDGPQAVVVSSRPTG